MSAKYKSTLEIKNFRSIEKQQIELAPITVVYGPNGAGKSSLLYAFLTLKNIVLNPNQNPNGFFNYGFVSLGSFDGVIFDHRKRDEIELGLTCTDGTVSVRYKVCFGENQGSFSLDFAATEHPPATIRLTVSFPYPANETAQETVLPDEVPFVVNWNGITAQVQPKQEEPGVQEEANRLAGHLNAPVETLRAVSVVPLKRGFSKPHFSSVPVSPMVITEDEIATELSNDKYTVSRISFYLEQCLERDFRVNVKPGTAIFSLDATDKKTGIASELVNEGFGVNQTVYLLAKCLHHDTKWVCIEEPEIHLHPTAVRRVARVLLQIVRDQDKHFLISTHSEPFLSALLTLAAEGELEPSELACYFARKEKKSSTFERQSVNAKGQIEGGLTSFIEGEMEDVRAFFATAKAKR